MIHEIRQARKGDLSIIEGLYQEAFRINFPEGDWKRIRRAARWRLQNAIDDEHEVMLVAEAEDGTLLGFIWWGVSFASDGERQAMIEGIGVIPEQRGRGLGAQLAEAMMQWAVRLQLVHRVTCRVSPRNAAVIRLLEKMGGEERFVEYSRDFPMRDNEFMREREAMVRQMLAALESDGGGG